ncbi:MULTISPECIES: hypothetical protein [Myroides]|uniref:Uncharacterized protein n=1 Tax=Myroides albus TaxID=2562892 RepID=A0A6I3LMW1_9FLAO|nr:MULTISPECIES: hypothetical protein [Myroides]MTG98826.1 hypothetical protein [Myroides albus]MVX36674.1 hypothetical protein [Myroides sp. LoEW2-1]UVD80480.1 protein Asterix [Myroides albus]
MVVWSGRGILALIFFLIGCVVPRIVFGKEVSGELVFSIGTLLAGIATWVLGVLWNEEKILFHEEDNQYYRYKNNHTLFWIPMQYIGVLYLISSVVTMWKVSVWGAIGLSIIAVIVLFFKKIKDSDLFSLADKKQIVSKFDKIEKVEENESIWQNR